MYIFMLVILKRMNHLPCSVVILSLILALVVSGKQPSTRKQSDIEKLLFELVRSQSVDTLHNEVVGLLVEHEAEAWLHWYNAEYQQYTAHVALAEYTYETNITDYNEQQFSDLEAEFASWMARQVRTAEAFTRTLPSNTDPDISRMLKLILLAKDSSDDEQLNKKISKLRNSMTSIYGTAKPDGYPLDHHAQVIDTSRDWDDLLHAWKVWRDETGPQIRPLFTQYVAERNNVSQANGWSDTGAFWRVTNFEEDNIEQITQTLYEEILPLYQQLHTYVRRKLIDYYSGHDISPSGPIPAHLLGNMWAQEWGGIMDIVKPFPCEDTDPTQQLLSQGYTASDMFETAEEFFTSLSLDPMTTTFWSKSMIERPDDGREVVCHGAASDLFTSDDFRIKMCTEIAAEDFYTIHHEMGHIEYFMQYANQPPIYRRGANAAFHEAIGDTISLSVMTPQHLKTVGLLNDTQMDDPSCTAGNPSKADLNYLMMIALKKIAFLPFGYLIDKYRWEVFRGHIDESNYNYAWWQIREEIQGIAAPIERSEADFDPGAKYHVPAQVPYIRYFLAHIGQFQFLKAMCDRAGHQGPLYKCDVYRSQEAGHLLKSMLELGCSKPWPDAMEVMTGQRQFKSDAIFEYFQPLYEWLKIQNANEHIGW